MAIRLMPNGAVLHSHAAAIATSLYSLILLFGLRVGLMFIQYPGRLFAH
jgi:hypothetical protein